MTLFPTLFGHGPRFGLVNLSHFQPRICRTYSNYNTTVNLIFYLTHLQNIFILYDEMINLFIKNGKEKLMRRDKKIIYRP